jgi:flagellar protein FliJ
MSKFQFSLQRLLDLRQRAEDEARCQLAASQRQVACEQDRLDRLQFACAEARGDATPVAGQTVTPALLLNNGLYASRLQMLAAVQQTHVDRSVVQERADCAHLLHKAQGRQVLQRLKERRHEQHLGEQTRRESRRAEEMASAVYVAKRLEAGRAGAA